MTGDDFGILKERFKEKKTLGEIAQTHDCSREWIRQRLSKILDEMIGYHYLEKWKSQKMISRRKTIKLALSATRK